MGERQYGPQAHKSHQIAPHTLLIEFLPLSNSPCHFSRRPPLPGQVHLACCALLSMCLFRLCAGMMHLAGEQVECMGLDMFKYK